MVLRVQGDRVQAEERGDARLVDDRLGAVVRFTQKILLRTASL